MSRQHSNLFRGTSNDQRVKAKTKKHRNAVDAERRPECNPIKTSESNDLKNTQALLNVTQSLLAFSQRHSGMWFNKNDLQLLKLTANQLTLMRKMDQYQREPNRGKTRELKGHLERIREKKAQLISDSERRNALLRSGSPRGRKGIIACQMSPPALGLGSYGLIERKIQEQNRQRATFEAIKKKQQCFGRMFEYIDKIADRLNVSKSEKIALTFKNYVSRIEASIQIIASRQIEMREAVKANMEYQDEIRKLKQQNEFILTQNERLKTDIEELSSHLQAVQISHERQMTERQKRYSQLEQDFALIAKEKLDIQTILSKHQHQCKKHKQILKNIKFKAIQIKQYAEQARNIQSSLRKCSKDYKNNLQCLSMETVNEIICAYTDELRMKTSKDSKLKKQITQLEIDKLKLTELCKVEVEKAKIQAKHQYNKAKLNSLGIFACIEENYIRPDAIKSMSIVQNEGICYVPEIKIDICTQTQTEKTIKLQLISNIHEIELHPRQRILTFEQSIIHCQYETYKQQSQNYTQTSLQNEQISLNLDSQAQTVHLQLDHTSMQTQIESQSVSTETTTSNLSILKQAYQFSPIHPKEKNDASTSTITYQLTSTCVINQVIIGIPQRQTVEEGTCTDNYASIYKQSAKQEQCKVEYFDQSSSKKKLQPNCEDSIFSLLLQAEECIIVPQIFLLREEIALYRSQIDRLSKKVQSLQCQREKQEETVFKFCY